MGRMPTEPSSPAITPARAARLYKLLSLMSEAPRTRKFLLGKLKIDIRGFYRDMECLRTLGVEIDFDGTKYQLVTPLDTATSMVPFPDPGLSIRDAIALSKGNSEAHKKLKKKLESFLGTSGK